MRRGCLLLWRCLRLLVAVLSGVGVILLGRGSVVGRMEVGVCWDTFGVVLVGLLLPHRVRAPNVGPGMGHWDGGCVA